MKDKPVCSVWQGKERRWQWCCCGSWSAAAKSTVHTDNERRQSADSEHETRQQDD